MAALYIPLYAATAVVVNTTGNVAIPTQKGSSYTGGYLLFTSAGPFAYCAIDLEDFSLPSWIDQSLISKVFAVGTSTHTNGGHSNAIQEAIVYIGGTAVDYWINTAASGTFPLSAQISPTPSFPDPTIIDFSTIKLSIELTASLILLTYGDYVNFTFFVAVEYNGELSVPCPNIPIFPTLAQVQSYDLTPQIVRSPGWNVKKTQAFSNEKQQIKSGRTSMIKYWDNPLWRWEFNYQYLKDNPADPNPYYQTGKVPATDLEVLESFFCGMQGQGSEFGYQPPDSVRGGSFPIVSVSVPSTDIAVLGINPSVSVLPLRLGDSVYVSGLSVVTGLNGQNGTVINRDRSANTITLKITASPHIYTADSGTAAGGQMLGAADANNNIELVNTVGGYPNPLVSDPEFVPIVEPVQLICPYTLAVRDGNGNLLLDYILADPSTVLIPTTEYYSGKKYRGYVLQFFSTPTPPVTASFNYYYYCRFSEDAQEFENFMAMLHLCSAMKLEQVRI
jgi:hypothetical protein